MLQSTKFPKFQAPDVNKIRQGFLQKFENYQQKKVSLFRKTTGIAVEGIFKKEDGKLHEQLGLLYTLRPQLESKQQNLLIKSIFLFRFIRLACLKQPETNMARKLLASILPDLQSLETDGGMRRLLKETSMISGNREN